jgi:hypothetical protein
MNMQYEELVFKNSRLRLVHSGILGSILMLVVGHAIGHLGWFR